MATQAQVREKGPNAVSWSIVECAWFAITPGKGSGASVEYAPAPKLSRRGRAGSKEAYIAICKSGLFLFGITLSYVVPIVSAVTAKRQLGVCVWTLGQTPSDIIIRAWNGIDSTALLTNLEKQYGLKLANGQDTLKGKILRIAHMGHIDAFDVLAALSALELVLLEMGHSVEPGAGVAAAQRVLAEGVAAPVTAGA